MSVFTPSGGGSSLLRLLRSKLESTAVESPLCQQATVPLQAVVRLLPGG